MNPQHATWYGMKDLNKARLLIIVLARMGTALYRPTMDDYLLLVVVIQIIKKSKVECAMKSYF